MFDKILIANRGEIAVRIIRTCKRLGIATVAVYSDADSRSLHRQLADESVYIGPPPAVESYLVTQEIISAALSKGCQAIHPGYGFLSENPDFASSVEAAGLAFIGPPAGVIAMMGDKIAAKELAGKAGVPIIPGYQHALENEEEAVTAAGRVGYPVLLKPAAGGGGKGMRIVREAKEMRDALSASRQETGKAFGDRRIFIERYIEEPRHIEIQIMADKHGKVIHLGERECSIQRRYQKIIEESPSPIIDPELRKRMGEAACNLARKAGYVNAGTVEFVLDAEKSFYFLEMNTRLQVEHPVTEMVNGMDMVELQIRIAAGEHLPYDQADIRFKGWAIEARICAEDPDRNFMPATGMITRYAEPRGNGIRVDSGVDTGSKISVYYDSLLAKVICHGQNREEARTRLIEALNGYHIEGFETNIDFVNSILAQPDFTKGNLTTGFIEQHFVGSKPKIPPKTNTLQKAVMTAAIIHHVRNVAMRASIQSMISRIGGKRTMSIVHNYMVRSNGEVFDVVLDRSISEHQWTAHVNGNAYAVESPEFAFYRRRLKLIIDGRIHRFRLRVEGSFIFVAFSGITQLFEIYTPREWELMKYMPEKKDHKAENVLICPMPGLVVSLAAQKGDRVFRGQTLVILESMKMESGVASPMDGVVADVQVAAGQTVETGEILMRFQPA